MKRLLRIYLFLCSLVGCTRITDLAPEGTPRVVVECVLTDADVQSLRLFMTDIAADEAKVVLEDARAVLVDSTAGVRYEFIRVSEGRWEVNHRATAGHLYGLKVYVPGYDRIVATTAMVDNFKVADDVRPLFDWWSSTLLPVEGIVEYGRYFHVDSLPASPVWIYAMNYNDSLGVHEVAEDIAISGNIMVDDFNITGRLWKFEGVAAIPDDYWFSYLYEDCTPTLYQEVEGRPVHDRYLRLPPVAPGHSRQMSADSTFQIAGSFGEGYYWVEKDISETDGYIGFITVSDEYDRFLKEALSYGLIKETSTDFSTVYSRANLYTNVVNALGIFGAKSAVAKAPWNDHVMTWQEKYFPKR